MRERKTATLAYGDKTVELPVTVGSEGEVGIDITALEKDMGLLAFDPGYANTGSCQSAITFVDGEKGILRHRGLPIEQLAERSSFIEVAMLLIFGKLPTAEERTAFRTLLSEHELLHEGLCSTISTAFPPGGQPMAILSAVINSLGNYHPELLRNPEHGRIHPGRGQAHQQGAHHRRLQLPQIPRACRSCIRTPTFPIAATSCT